MRNLRSYYSASIAKLLRQSSSEIIGNIHSNDISIVITRDLNKAKAWVRDYCQGTTRYGLLASSVALRQKKEFVTSGYP